VLDKEGGCWPWLALTHFMANEVILMAASTRMTTEKALLTNSCIEVMYN
jgi:hypothetical protein